MNTKLTLGVVAISYNEEKDLPGFLGHLIAWVDEIVIVDDGSNDATINVTVSGSANFTTRRHIMKTVNVPADSTLVIEKPINLGAGDKLETQASANGDLEVFASILEIT